MEIIVPLQVKVCLPEDEVVPIENLVYVLKDLKIEAKLLEQLINKADAVIVTKLCGEKYTKITALQRNEWVNSLVIYHTD